MISSKRSDALELLTTLLCSALQLYDSTLRTV